MRGGCKYRCDRRTVLAGVAGAAAAELTAPRVVGSNEVSPQPTTPVLGANLNGRPRRLDDTLELLDASDTTWVRAFLDVREKVDDGTDPEKDPDVVALRRAARQKGCKLVVSLKWDFAGSWGRREAVPVPRPGSERERTLLECATRYLESVGAHVDVVVLGNEPMWETRDEDVRVAEPPIVDFTRAVKDQLVEHYGGDPHFLAGAFNRLYDDVVREQQYPEFYRRTLELVRTDDDVDGVDLHVHFDQFAEAEEMVATVREDLPDAMLTATEFSPVMRYERYKNEPIDRSDAGRRFAAEYDVPAGTTVVEYLDAATEDPVSRAELRDFMDAMPWYNTDHLADMCDLFDEYDVRVGTFGFLQGRAMRDEDWTTDWIPFHINFLFQRALLATDPGVHPHYFDDYCDRTGTE